MTNTELRNQRAKAIADMQALSIKAEAEGRDLNTEERSSYDKMKADVTALKGRYERMEEQEQLERELNASTGRIVDPLQSRSADTRTIDTKQYRSAMDHFLRTGSDVQLRAIGTSAASGNLLPVDVVTEVMNALNRGSVVRKAGATVYTTATNANIPISSAVTGTFEAETVSYASAEPTYTAFTAKAWKVTGKALLSKEFLDDAGFDVQGHITARLVDGMSQTADNKYVIGAGSGSSLPTGLIGSSGATNFVASGLAAPTAVDIFNWFYAVPSQYRQSANFAFILSDTMIGSISSLGNVVGGGSDVTIRVPFLPGLTPGAPDTLFGKPVYSSAAVTAAPAANALLGVAADMSKYAIVDRIQNNFGITRLNELYAETGQVMFIGSFRTDGMLTIADAGRTYKCSAS